MKKFELPYDRWMNLIAAARGDIKVDKCLRNARLINPFTGKVHETDIAIHSGIIVGLGNYDAHENIDIKGEYVCSGFIEGHIHIESSMLSPIRFCEAVVKWGTTTVVADPHEIANVMGDAGLEYFLKCAEKIKFVDLYFMLPSCVPASPFETSGSSLDAVDLFRYINHPRVIGLGEVMNFPGVINGIKDVWNKLLLFNNHPMDGHAPQLTGQQLNAYVLAGIGSDHECTTENEAREKLSRGMTIMIREGSQTKDIEALIPIIDDNTWPRCMFVSDDRHPDDLINRGHLNVQINKAMELGLPPVRALSLASWTPALYFGFRDRGALVPGYIADFSISESINPWKPKRVFKKGVEVFRNGVFLESLPEVSPPSSPMAIKHFYEESIRVPASESTSKKIRVIGLKENTILTDHLIVDATVKDGFVVADVERDILKIVVWNRYSSEAKPTVGFCKGFGFKKGAIASTIAHDNHNLIAVGCDDRSIINAAKALKECGGGIAVCTSSDDVDFLPLPIGGLMSDKSAEEVAENLNRLKEKTSEIGSKIENPFMALSFLALPVIPELKITDQGLVDVMKFSFTSLFTDQEQ